MWNFLKNHWVPIVVGICGLTIGFLLNVYANRKSEKRIIEALMVQIAAIKEKQSTVRITQEEQTILTLLESQLKILTH